MPRCEWCGDDPLYVEYHDREWGVPRRDSRELFEMLTLEGFQAGLSWITILRKRENFRAAFAGFRPQILAGWGAPEVERLLGDAGIVRHRGKIEATLSNARQWCRLEEARPGAFSDLVWDSVGGTPRQEGRRQHADLPSVTPEATALAKKLKAEGFRFCGPTTTYAFMQAAGLINDHVADCPRHAELAG
ncbi:DNA-3-methyladenine glycosylase [Brevirhabdus pacifica]|uniref:DNA-3-methyladenine glycosylase n=1 Tax=Brevirhabdus pacifica TaxID=1267768 RepID=A0A1U7DI51_9RHOB|nr:DNA-3-methyladenine glycosylase I [Brevirhabdus pacifica]APX89548.1 DNA-3-methyladenine glycosylase [Brevirhabdus pacifica]OWU76447.1 DNA-3-methyladenine glycosylase [Loktanella sp. 22II-4b]PJJ85792.1 DNA-3-methyladenine glycosylase I [Brevirhabdus pacifica]